MKIFILAFCLMFMYIGIGNSCSQSKLDPTRSVNSTKVSQSSACPISLKTTKIIYMYHTGSGMAVYTTITLGEDCLIWEYDEARNNCSLKDSCKYSKEEFEQLVKSLSTIEFSAIDTDDDRVGGAGDGYSFESNSSMYLYYDSSYNLSGNYRQVSSLIQQFIEAHKTKCEMLFEKLSRKPHERGHFGEFRTLPKELEKYKVNKRF